MFLQGCPTDQYLEPFVRELSHTLTVQIRNELARSQIKHTYLAKSRNMLLIYIPLENTAELKWLVFVHGLAGTHMGVFRKCWYVICIQIVTERTDTFNEALYRIYTCCANKKPRGNQAVCQGHNDKTHSITHNTLPLEIHTGTYPGVGMGGQSINWPVQWIWEQFLISRNWVSQVFPTSKNWPVQWLWRTVSYITELVFTSFPNVNCGQLSCFEIISINQKSSFISTINIVSQ